jgi:hypothetical protein
VAALLLSAGVGAAGAGLGLLALLTTVGTRADDEYS